MTFRICGENDLSVILGELLGLRVIAVELDGALRVRYPFQRIRAWRNGVIDL
jgi:hypothetical protein